MVYLNWRDVAGEVLQPRQDDTAQQPAEDNSRKVSPIGTFFIVLAVLLVVGAVGWVVFTQLRARRLGLPAPSWSSYNPFSRSDRSSPYGPPTPAPGGIRGWLSDKFGALRGGRRNPRSAAGAYERRGFGPLDPDEAWDTRVGHEADGYGGGGGGGGGGGSGGVYEQELSSSTRYGGRGGGGGGGGGGERDFDGGGGADNSTPYSGSGYDMNLAADDDDHERGRTRSRSPGPAPGRGGGGRGESGPGRSNPFDDDAEPSNVSLRGVSPRPIDTGAARKAGGGGHRGSGSPTSERRSIFRENM